MEIEPSSEEAQTDITEGNSGGVATLAPLEQNSNDSGRKRKSDPLLPESDSVTLIGEERGDDSRRKAKHDVLLLSSSDEAATEEDHSGFGDAAAEDEASSEPSDEPENEPENEVWKSRRADLPSVLRRQQEDPELRKQIHKVETDLYYDRISREVYNAERFKLYTEEELKEKRIVWPKPEACSPAVFRENELAGANHRNVSNNFIGDLLFRFGVPFDENGGLDEEAARQRWREEIEAEFEETVAKAAEYERWEKIREVETEFTNEEMEEEEYNERRFALYTEEERNESGIVWPDDEEGENGIFSPAGYRDDVFEGCWRDPVDWETRMEFHFTGYDDDEDDVEDNLCELCIPLVKEAKKKIEKYRKRWATEAEERAEERAEKEAEETKFGCPHCDRRFKLEMGCRQHVAHAHKDKESVIPEVVVPEKTERGKQQNVGTGAVPLGFFSLSEFVINGKERNPEVVVPEKTEGGKQKGVGKAAGESKPYRCTVCNKKFGTDQGVRAHSAAKHGSSRL